MIRVAIKNSNLLVPRIVFGTSSLGNLYEVVSDDAKYKIAKQWFQHVGPSVFLDTAGKYGAGLALESIGQNLRRLNVPPEQVIISNKLGWKRVALHSAGATFEPEVWAGLKHDAQQCMSEAGILECWQQGCELLGPPYRTSMVSVHDPDEYLAAAKTARERKQRMDDVIAAYRALGDLKKAGQVDAVGVGSKDWRIIEWIANVVHLDWVMLANSLTIYRHPPEVVDFVDRLSKRGITVINSAVFHAGFLTGGRYFDYRIATSEHDAVLFAWRENFLALCQRHSVSPMVACVQFALSPPGVAAVSLNTSRPERVGENVASVEAVVPRAFWKDAKDAELIAHNYPHVC